MKSKNKKLFKFFLSISITLSLIVVLVLNLKDIVNSVSNTFDSLANIQSDVRNSISRIPASIENEITQNVPNSKESNIVSQNEKTFSNDIKPVMTHSNNAIVQNTKSPTKIQKKSNKISKSKYIQKNKHLVHQKSNQFHKVQRGSNLITIQRKYRPGQTPIPISKTKKSNSFSVALTDQKK